MVTWNRSKLLIGLSGAVVLVWGACCLLGGPSGQVGALPAPARKGKMSLEETLSQRRSVRRFRQRRLTRGQIGQLCWAAQGISSKALGFRTCPSAGALYPLELYVVSPGGVEHYVPRGHRLEAHKEGDLRGELMRACLHQRAIGQAGATFVIAAVTARTQRKYGRRARRYVLLEAGHAAQNLLLQAQALHLGAVPVGAFEDGKVAQVLALPADQTPVYVVPVGVPAKG